MSSRLAIALASALQLPRALPRVVPVVALALASGCASTGLSDQVYRGDGFAFRIGQVPSSWQAIRVSDAALAWRDEAAGGTVVVNARCDRDGEDVPLAALTQHLFLKFTDRTIQKEETVPLDGREALHTQITAKLDGVPKAFSVWVVKKDGCVYDLVYIADPGRFEAGVGPFDAFARQLQALPRGEHGAP